MTAKRGERQRESCIDDDMLDEFPSELTAEQLAALLCARLCHDLVSPVSALGAALSVLDDKDSADMHEDAMGLVRESARQAQAKLEFSRRWSARLRSVLTAWASPPASRIVCTTELMPPPRT